ncbi:hypothetical protein LTR36_005231 [Oleoguttula mirabilis]|uniref:Uncharacterized protein n=1 Tax=Oleoguttula mirabilis TaxID=1507867 RepID=A0AAV9JWE6_9PEZI|nr:hypothetical protein LTR36_005231 [Oleoguttula mirabilis]
MTIDSSYDDLPELDRPPTYAATDPLHPSNSVSNHANTDETPPNFPTYSIVSSHTSSGLNITHDEHQLYYIGRYDHQAKPELALYGGYDAYGPQLALAKFGLREKDFAIYLGGLKHPGANDWDVVRHATDGRLFHHPLYRFEITSSTASTDDRAPRVKQRLHWQKTHESKLGASYFSMRDFKLVDEGGDDEVLAVFTDHGRAGKLEFRRRVDERVEIAALITLMAMVERMKRVVGAAAKAVGA